MSDSVIRGFVRFTGAVVAFSASCFSIWASHGVQCSRIAVGILFRLYLECVEYTRWHSFLFFAHYQSNQNRRLTCITILGCILFVFVAIQPTLTGWSNVNHPKNRMCNEWHDIQSLACFPSNGLMSNLSAHLIQPLISIGKSNQKQYKISKSIKNHC